ncbi:hypothetical protein CGZ94_04890 [Enemella evansiae]|uniref:HNH nuclease domain-containing protein n=1 Tax=Enemella evansiae TaxID=2016499 RepID=A0A255GKC8_9ACTN|nr:HNH endonuclease [Enemella evansiae]OYO16279.1 hypothetical protein CGZ94_04890 [Enemella evansiae]
MADVSRYSLDDGRWKRVCLVVKARDGYRCVSCGARDDLTVDHIKPISKMSADELAAGHQYDPDRCLTLCRPCNASKGDRAVLRKTWINPRWSACFSEVVPEAALHRVESFSHGEGSEISGVIL